MKTKGFFISLWKWTRRILLWLFIAQFLYIIILKWVNPPITITHLLREYPELRARQELYRMYKDIMINQDIPWVDISGKDEDRLHKAIHAVDNLLG